ncbi:MAG: GntR family transcriptional regulator [Firmicutes bacterium]|nr:GntR family transcriptional regulator [Bacillota bacterium]
MTEIKKVVLNRNSSVPIYHQLREKIRKHILVQELPAHTIMPSESQLMASVGASRATVRAALLDLEKEGWIYRVQGKGTYVAPPRISRRFRSMISFTEEIKGKGLEPSSTLLRAEQVSAPALVREKMELEPQAEVVVVERIRFADGRPIGLNLSHINADLCPDIQNRADLSRGSLYDIINDLYEIRITKATRTLESRQCPEELRDVLEVSGGEPILLLTGVVYAESGRALDYCVEYYREDWQEPEVLK